MRGLMRKIKVPLLLLLLLAVSVFPALLIAYQNSRQLSKVSFSPYTAQLITQTADATANQNSGADATVSQDSDSADLREKLLIWAASSNGNGVKTVEKLDASNKQIETALLDAMITQFSELQRLKAIPQFALIGQGNIYDLRKMKIMDQAAGNSWLELWDISADFEDVTVSVIMDVETDLLLCIYARSDTVSMNLTDILFGAYVKYLSLDGSQIIFRANNKAIGEGNIYGTYQLLNDDFLVNYEVSSSDMHFQYFFRDALKISS